MKRIDILPNDVLLEIFDFYLDMYSIYDFKPYIEVWQLLVHVCRRWRSLVLGSPRRLNLRLHCTPATPAKDTMDVWPALPLIVEGCTSLTPSTDNIIAALGQSNCVCQVNLHLFLVRELEEVLAVMQVPFPEMTQMKLFARVDDDETPPVIPDSFLGGSAPRLQHFQLLGIPFPGLPKLLSSATHLVSLSLTSIPHSGYISPEAMVTLLSVLSGLRRFVLEFRSPQSRPDWEILSPLKRSILPVLDEFLFTGVGTYLGELVTHIDTPRLHKMLIELFNQIDFDCPRLARFLNRTPTLSACDEAQVRFSDTAVNVILRYRTSGTDSNYLLIEISCSESDLQLSSIERVCNFTLYPPLSAVEDLYIGSERRYSALVWKDDAIENSLWLQLLLPFTAVKNLYLSKEFAPGIAAALQELAVGGRMTEVLPSLLTIFVEGIGPWGPFQEHIGQFIVARRLSDHPITISVWDKDSNLDWG